jgi:HK97 family phage major capsid protein
VFVLSSTDFAAAQLLQAQTSGLYLQQGAPNERPPSTLWGVPTVVSTGLPAKTGLLLNKSGLALYTDQQGIRIDWSPGATGFEHNTVTARCEGRFDLAVLQPGAQVSIATAA